MTTRDGVDDASDTCRTVHKQKVNCGWAGGVFFFLGMSRPVDWLYFFDYTFGMWNLGVTIIRRYTEVASNSEIFLCARNLHEMYIHFLWTICSVDLKQHSTAMPCSNCIIGGQSYARGTCSVLGESHNCNGRGRKLSSRSVVRPTLAFDRLFGHFRYRAYNRRLQLRDCALWGVIWHCCRQECCSWTCRAVEMLVSK